MAVPQKQIGHAAPASGSSLASLIEDAQGLQGAVEDRWPITPNQPFFFMHWAIDWSVETEGMRGGKATWLPGLVKHIVEPGVNNNRTRKSGQKASSTYDMAVMQNIDKGAQYLDPDRDTLPGGGKYAKQAKARSRLGREGMFYFDAFSLPMDTLPGRKMKFRFDRAAFNQWRLSLVESGVIRPPSDRILDEVRNRRIKRESRVRALTALESGEYKRRVKLAEGATALYRGAIVPGQKGAGRRAGLSSPGDVQEPGGGE